MSMPGRVTTTDNLRRNAGQMCQGCKLRVPLTRFLDGTGHVCPDCDPRRAKNLVELMPDDAPVDRGRG